MITPHIIDPGWKWDENFPLSQGLKIGNLLFLSGQVAVDADGQIVGKGDLGAQTRQVFENMKTVLEQAGAGFDNVVKMTSYFTTNIENYEEYFAVRREYFTKFNPASTGVQAALAFEDLLLEVEAIAYLPDAALAFEDLLLEVRGIAYLPDEALTDSAEGEQRFFPRDEHL